ncbi:KEOPS complex subunit Cgi121 [Methanorbis furvi]|uniref:Kinase binding protein CGI-121 n=1 Tax=Methanorbis furvi TaxID=3028299 RepID=A0AAE4MCP1_9EURY|nr:hypothetical protein [Methanocorpusculaceae archaeon Ag1]
MMEKSLEIYSAEAVVDDVAAALSLVNAAAKTANAVIVLFDAEKITGPNHIRSAVMHAERSFASGKPVARTLSMEILLYASGQRQCSFAPQFGLHLEKNYLYVAVLGGDFAKARDLLLDVAVPKDHQMTANVSVLMELFGITAEEIEVVGVERIEELVLERVAMMDAYK